MSDKPDLITFRLNGLRKRGDTYNVGDVLYTPSRRQWDIMVPCNNPYSTSEYIRVATNSQMFVDKYLKAALKKKARPISNISIKEENPRPNLADIELTVNKNGGIITEFRIYDGTEVTKDLETIEQERKEIYRTSELYGVFQLTATTLDDN
jgi:hypothetical protein